MLTWGAVVLASIFVSVSGAAERYSLEKEVHNDFERSSTAIYFDHQEQRLITKTLTWTEEFEKRRKSSGRERLSFPATASNISRISPRSFKGHNIQAEYQTYSLYNPIVDNSISNELKKHFGPKVSAKEFLKSMQSKVDRGTSQFTLVSSSSSGSGRKSKDAAIYYNKKSGKFITKIFKHRAAGVPKFKFPSSIARPVVLDSKDEKQYSLKESHRYDAKTPIQFETALSKIRREYKDQKIPLDNSKFATALNQMKDIRAKDILVTEEYRKGSKSYSIYYNFDRQEMVLIEKEFNSKKSSKIQSIKETVFDLTNELGYKNARMALVDNKVYTENQLDQFRGSDLTYCKGVIDSHILPDLNRFDNITDALWDRHLQSAIANNLIPLKNKSLVLEVNLLDKARRVKIFLDAQGQIGKVEWAGMSKAEAEKEGLRISYQRDQDGQRNFLISTNYPDGDWKPALGINTDKIRTEGGNLKGNIAVFVKGRKNGEFKYEGFEKNIFPFELDKNKNIFNEVGSRTRLDGNFKNNYDIDAPVVTGSGGIKNAFFKLFYSKRKRKETARDTIYEGAKESLSDPNFRRLISGNEIWNLSNEIVDELGKRTDNYSDNLTSLSIKATELAYSIFGDEILGRIIKDMLPRESSEAIKEMVFKVTENFKKCLANAAESRNIKVAEKCMEIYKTEAAVHVGAEVLALKLEQNELADSREDAEKLYLTCIQEEYRPAPKNMDSTNKIKGCLYLAFIGTIDKAMGPTVAKEITKILESKGINLKLSSAKKNKLVSQMRVCFRDRGLQSKGVFGAKYNFSSLEKLEPQEFEQKIMSCIDEVKIGSGRFVVDTILEVELAKQDLSVKMRLSTQKEALENGYEACIEKQTEIKNNVIYEKSKGVDEYNGRPRPDSVAISPTPSIEPAECANLVLNKTLSLVVPELVKKTIGEEFYKDLLKLTKTKPDFIICFKKEEQRFFGELKKVMIEEIGISKKSKSRNIEIREKRADASHATCLKKALAWASFYSAGKIVEDTIKLDVKLSKTIKISKEDKTLMGKKTRLCFNKELSKAHTVEAVTNSLETIKEKCGVNLLMDKDVQKIIFHPVIVKALDSAGIKGSDQKKLISKIMFGMNKDMKGTRTTEEAISRAKGSKGKAVLLVIDFTLEQKISALVDLEDEALKSAEVKRILRLVENEIMSSKGGDFKRKILISSVSRDEASMDKSIGELKVAATKLIGSEVLEMTGKKLLEEGLLDTKKEIELMRSRAEGILKLCFKIRPKGLSVDEHVEECILKVKSETTEWVISTSLRKNLIEEENSRIFSLEDQAKIINSILDDEAKMEISRIGRIKNSEESEKELKKLIVSVKSSAARKIVAGVIPYTLDQVLTVSKRSSPQMRKKTLKFKAEIEKELVTEFDICVDNYKLNATRALEGSRESSNYRPDEEFNACANKLRLSTMERIIPFKFDEIIRLLNHNVKDNDKVVKRSLRSFRKCSETGDIYSDTKDFRYKMDACSAMAIFSFSRNLIIYGRDIADGLFVQNDKTIKEWDVCLSEVKESIYNKISPYTDDKSFSIHTKSMTFFTEAFRVNAYVKEKSFKPVTMKWVSDQVKECSLTSLAPNLLQEYKMKVITDSALKLTVEERAITGLFIDTFGGILSTKYSGKAVDFGIDKFVKELNEELDKLPKNKSRKSQEEKDFITAMEEFQPLIYKYVKELIGFDNESFSEGIKDFEKKVQESIRLNKGKISIEKIKNILVESQLGEALLKSLVSKIIKDKVTEALKKQGVNGAGVGQGLSSSSMINNIFESKRGKGTMTFIKRKLRDLNMKEIFELLDSSKPKGKSNKLMKEINVKVIDTLISDTNNGGFVETLFAPIVQKRLTANRESIENGLSSVFIILMGYNYNDFHWGTPWDNRPYSLRRTPSGKKAVRNFAEKVLRPLMKEGLTDSEVEKRVEKYVSPYVKEALNENGVGPWD